MTAAVVHYPKSLPRLSDHGAPVEPTEGDVLAIHAGAVRLVRGETIESVSRTGERIVIRGSTLTVGEQVREFDSSYDALVVAYGAISNFNRAWADFEGAQR